MYWDSYNTINRLDHYLPVDVYVAGCCHAPKHFWQDLINLKELIRQGKGEGAIYTAQNFDWYKANQKKVIKDWDMPDYNW